MFTVGPSGEWTQEVSASGELLVEIHEADGRLDAAEALLKQRLSAPFVLDREWPIRAAVITSGPAPAQVLLVLSHMAADFASLDIIARDFRRLLRSSMSQAPEPSTLQPLDQAELEKSPLARQRAEAALRYWETTLRGTPQCMLAVPRHQPANSGPRMATLRSRAAALAMARIADRTRASQSVVILAAVATLLGLRTVNDRCQITSLCANRVTPGQPRLRGHDRTGRAHRRRPDRRNVRRNHPGDPYGSADGLLSQSVRRRKPLADH